MIRCFIVKPISQFKFNISVCDLSSSAFIYEYSLRHIHFLEHHLNHLKFMFVLVELIHIQQYMYCESVKIIGNYFISETTFHLLLTYQLIEHKLPLPLAKHLFSSVRQALIDSDQFVCSLWLLLCL